MILLIYFFHASNKTFMTNNLINKYEFMTDSSDIVSAIHNFLPFHEFTNIIVTFSRFMHQ